MADVKSLKDRGLPLKIDGSTRFVKGATKYTTCADVIKMVLKKTGIGKEYRHCFAIYEITNDGESVLSGKTRILKVAKSWDCDRNKFALRKINVMDNVNSAKTSETGTAKSKESKKSDHKLLSKITSALHGRSKRGSTKNKENVENRVCAESHVCDTSSASDSSLEEFMAGIDKSKMVEFIKFFNAMTTHEEKNRRAKRSTHVNVAEDEPKRNHQLKSCKRRSRQSRRIRSKSRRRPLGDVHPSKFHSVHRLDYGFIDNLQTVNANQIGSAEKVYPASDIESSSKMDADHISDSEAFKRRKHLNASDVKDMLTQSFSMTRNGSTLKPECREIWNDDFSRENVPYSLSSDESLDRDSVLSYFDKIAAHDLHAHERISSVNKLVDYSITDDEISDIETDESDYQLNHNIMDIGYVTADTSFSESCSNGRCELMETSLAQCGYHDNQGFTFSSDSDNDEALFSQTGSNLKPNKTIEEVANTSDYIRSLFSKTHAQTEDEEMDSFMKSKVIDDSLEEGLSWIHSDDEKDTEL